MIFHKTFKNDGKNILSKNTKEWVFGKTRISGNAAKEFMNSSTRGSPGIVGCVCIFRNYLTISLGCFSENLGSKI